MITGAQIKDNTVTTADIKNGNLSSKDLSPAAKKSLKGKTGNPGLSGLEFVEQSVVLNPGEDSSVSAECPDNKRPISVTGDFFNSNLPTSTRLGQGLGARGYSYGNNTSGVDDTLRVQVLCAITS
jgi:hypothetical protein